MTDIKDIMLWIPVNIINSLLFIIFVFSLYFFWKYLSNKPIIIEEEEIIIPKEVIDYKKLINIFEEKYLKENKEIFYSKLSEILKNYLEDKKTINISKMTFSEINKLDLNNNILELIKNIYFKEYAKEIEDNVEIRKILIKEVKNIIK